jgi:hypothetical protein
MTLFDPSRDDVRRFFCEVWRKHRQREVLTPIEAIALDGVRQHPEYHDLLLDADAAVAREFRIEDGATNPFLHLSMHLAIAEQLSIDQPPGLRAAYERLVRRTGDPHVAAHEVMECLGEVIWSAQRTGARTAEELNAAYLECLARRAGPVGA